MNDRYLFKGKRKDNGEWVKGQLLESNFSTFIVTMVNTIIDTSKTEHEQERIWSIEYFKVDPSTICQCTGLKDKNGNLIWENDIIVGHLDDKFPEDATYARVLWYNNGFCTQEHYSGDVEPLDKFDQNNFEVCSNIFDNPELLEVEE